MTAHGILHLMNGIVLSLVPGVPLLVTFGCLFLSTRERAYRLLPWAPLPALLAGLFIPGDIVVRVPWFFLGSSMGLDPTGRTFLVLTACVWLLASISGRDRFRRASRRFRFAAYFSASMTGNLGLILAGDVLGYYLFFAIMSFSVYGLICHHRTDAAYKAGRVYLALVIVSELAMFAALVILTARGQTASFGDIPPGAFSMAVVLLLFITFGIKIGALPFQAWMVLAYQQAPIPAAAALAGAMVNAGILGWLRFFPFGQVVMPAGAFLFIAMGAAATVCGVAYGIFQNKIGRAFASSSISQMGLMTTVAGFGLLSPEKGRYAATLLILYAVHHSLAKTSLFLGYDMIDRGGRIPRPLLLAGLLLPSLSLAGFPLTSGAIVKTGVKGLAAAGGDPWPLFGTVFLPASSAGTAMLMLHCTRLLWRHRGHSQAGQQDAGRWVWAVSVAAVASALWLWPAAHGLMGRALQPGALADSLWPAALGALLALGWFRTGPQIQGRCPSLPDFDALLRGLAGAFMTVLAFVTKTMEQGRRVFASKAFHRCCSLSPASALSQRLDTAERVLSRWSVMGFLYLVVCVWILLLAG